MNPLSDPDQPQPAASSDPADRTGPPAPGGRRWPRRLAATVGVLMLVAAGSAGYWYLDREPAESGPVTAALPTKPITRSDLVSSVQVSGRLGFAGSYQLVGQRTGTVTWVPRPGDVVERGERILEVDLRPIPLLIGSVPFYRPLSPGSEGADVRQLERNLVELDHADPDDLTVDESYTPATAQAVRRWQKELGVDETGTLAPGDALVAAGSVRISTVDPLIGQQTQSGAPVLTGTGTGHSVQLDLQLSYRPLVRVGQTVRVQLPNGRTVEGKVATLGSTAQTGSNDSQGQAPAQNSGTAAQTGGQPSACQGSSCPSTAPVEISVLGPESQLGGVFEGQVMVTFPAETRRDVLSVPIDALTVGPDGTFAVVVVDPAGRRTVPVQTGMFTTGRVEVSGEGLAEGNQVEVPTL